MPKFLPFVLFVTEEEMKAKVKLLDLTYTTVILVLIKDDALNLLSMPILQTSRG